jgi:hypothetical protein
MRAAVKTRELDFSKFPAGAVTEYTTLVCLSCIFKLFTKQFGLAPTTAYSEIKKYAPTVPELTAPVAVRPFFDSDETSPHCPHCNATKRWHARLDTYRIEGGKTTDALRRALLKTLPTRDDQFRSDAGVPRAPGTESRLGRSLFRCARSAMFRAAR